MSSDLQWTKEKPTEPGWYWLQRVYGDARAVKVVRRADGVLLMSDGTSFPEVENANWAGPIPLPPEPWDDEVTEADIRTMVEVWMLEGHTGKQYLHSGTLLGIVMRGNEKWYVCENENKDMTPRCWRYARRIRGKT